MTDLDKLIAAVEAGTLCQGDTISKADGDLIDACFPLWDDEVGAWEYVALAMDGSLDAAKRLKDAIAPDVGCAMNLELGLVRLYGKGINGSIGAEVEGNLARALLLALLKFKRGAQ